MDIFMDKAEILSREKTPHDARTQRASDEEMQAAKQQRTPEEMDAIFHDRLEDAKLRARSELKLKEWDKYKWVTNCLGDAQSYQHLTHRRPFPLIRCILPTIISKPWVYLIFQSRVNMQGAKTHFRECGPNTRPHVIDG
jgi:hypothetical protein